jgi:hypothetical protein
VLSTKSAAAAFDGFPFGSVVEFAVDAEVCAPLIMITAPHRRGCGAPHTGASQPLLRQSPTSAASPRAGPAPRRNSIRPFPQHHELLLLHTQARLYACAELHAPTQDSAPGPTPGALPPQGRPILATSTLSPHTGDLIADGRCSLTVTAPGFQVRGAGACEREMGSPLPRALGDAAVRRECRRLERLPAVHTARTQSWESGLRRGPVNCC